MAHQGEHFSFTVGERVERALRPWPVDQSVLAKNKDEFPTPPGLFDIASLGGWEKVNAEFFDPENGSIAEVEQSLGVATQ